MHPGLEPRHRVAQRLLGLRGLGQPRLGGGAPLALQGRPAEVDLELLVDVLQHGLGLLLGLGQPLLELRLPVALLGAAGARLFQLGLEGLGSRLELGGAPLMLVGIRARPSELRAQLAKLRLEPAALVLVAAERLGGLLGLAPRVLELRLRGAAALAFLEHLGGRLIGLRANVGQPSLQLTATLLRTAHRVAQLGQLIAKAGLLLALRLRLRKLLAQLVEGGVGLALALLCRRRALLRRLEGGLGVRPPLLELLLARLQLVAPRGLGVHHPLQQALELVAAPAGAVELVTRLAQPVLEAAYASPRAAADVLVGRFRLGWRLRFAARPRHAALVQFRSPVRLAHFSQYA